LCRKIESKEVSFARNDLSNEAKHLITKLLEKKVEKRIKVEEIPDHPWFSGISFENLSIGKLDAPFIPKIVFAI